MLYEYRGHQVTVNDEGLELRPALFWAVTLLGSAGSLADELKV